MRAPAINFYTGYGSHFTTENNLGRWYSAMHNIVRSDYYALYLVLNTV